MANVEVQVGRLEELLGSQAKHTATVEEQWQAHKKGSVVGTGGEDSPSDFSCEPLGVGLRGDGTIGANAGA